MNIQSLGILGREEIADLLDSKVVENALYGNINPASLNVTLGNIFLQERRHPHNSSGFHYLPCDFSRRAEVGMTPAFDTITESVVLEPGAFVLASLVEKLNLPNDKIGRAHV